MRWDEGRLFFLDAIRAFSILLIIVAHFNDAVRELGAAGHVFTANPANLGVSLFIILSGASLMASHGRELHVAAFYRKRFLAIFPLFWVCYLLFYLALSLETRSFPPLQGAPVKYLLTVVGMDGFLLYKSDNFYLIGEWFLGLIIIFYLFFPLLRRVVLRLRMWAMPLAFLAVSLSIVLHGAFSVGMGVNRFPPARVLEFVFGMLFVRYWQGEETTAGKGRLIVMSVATLAGMYYFFKPVWFMKIVLAGVVAFPLLAFLASPLRNRVTEPLVSFLSAYSYGAFLVHHQLIGLLFATIPGLAGLVLADVLYQLFFAYLAVVFLLSLLVTRMTRVVLGRLASVVSRKNHCHEARG